MSEKKFGAKIERKEETQKEFGREILEKFREIKDEFSPSEIIKFLVGNFKTDKGYEYLCRVYPLLPPEMRKEIDDGICKLISEGKDSERGKIRLQGLRDKADWHWRGDTPRGEKLTKEELENWYKKPLDLKLKAYTEIKKMREKIDETEKNLLKDFSNILPPGTELKINIVSLKEPKGEKGDRIELQKQIYQYLNLIEQKQPEIIKADIIESLAEFLYEDRMT